MKNAIYYIRKMRNGTYYLNNNGSRWVNFTNGKKDQIVVRTPGGENHLRTVLYYESFGNFAVAAFSYKGKIERRFFTGEYMPENGFILSGLPIVNLEQSI